MYITLQSIVTFGAALTAIIAIIRTYNRGYKMVLHQPEQDKQIEAIKDEQKEIRAEQVILTRGILACLKGLQEQGCNGAVTEEINEIESYLNEQAHK